MEKVGGEGFGDEQSAMWQCWGKTFQAGGTAGAKALRQQQTGHAQGPQSTVSVAGMQGARWGRCRERPEGPQGVWV